MPERTFELRPGFSVFHYATDFDVWKDWFFPGLHDSFGFLWPLLLAAFVGAGSTRSGAATGSPGPGRRRPGHRGRLRVHAAHRGRRGGAADRVRVERSLHRPGRGRRARAAPVPAARAAQRAGTPDHARWDGGPLRGDDRLAGPVAAGPREGCARRSGAVLVGASRSSAGFAPAAGWARGTPLAWGAGWRRWSLWRACARAGGSSATTSSAATTI